MTTIHYLPLPFTKPPLNLNDRMHWAQKARITREVRDAVCVLARHRDHPIGSHDHVTVELHWVPAINRVRDPLNASATTKVCVDGLVDAGVVPGDDPRYVTDRVPVIHPKAESGVGRMWLEITTGETE